MNSFKRQLSKGSQDESSKESITSEQVQNREVEIVDGKKSRAQGMLLFLCFIIITVCFAKSF